tara:strand:- start:363 stop:749 length:387 start_codon:yes stop_codon:yes gene_type:complete
MDELNKDQILKLTGLNESELESMIQTEYGEQNMQYLAQWAKVTQLSLKANRLIITQCLVTDDENHILCRFCGEGIPNWKQENSREHTAECPINNITEALMAVKGLRNSMSEQDTNHEANNTMPGRSIQ